MIRSLSVESLFSLGLLIAGVIVAGLLLLNRLFPLIETRSSDELQLDEARPNVVGRTQITPLTPPGRRPLDLWSEQPTLAPARLRRYWRANLIVIAPLLLLWLGGSIGPALFAPALNRVQLGDFPLGYYLGAQSSLLLFVALIVGYGWAAASIERRYSRTQPQAVASEPLLRRRLLLFVVSFGLLLFGLEQLETRLGVRSDIIGWTLLLATLATYAVIGLRSRSHSLAEYYVAGRRVTPLFNGLAIGADWMSAATFIALAGALWSLGYEGLAYIMGWTGGYVLLALLIAPYLRRFGQYTVPDFIGARYGGPARIVAALLGIVISFTYLTAQVTGVGIIMSQFLGVSYVLGVLIGLSAVLFCSFVGGMQAITWTQVVQCTILIIAYLAPVTWMAYRVTGVPLPQLMFGQALREIAVLESAAGIKLRYVDPFNSWSRWHFVALTLCLMMGTAGLPHLLARCYTTPSVRATRQSISWAIVFIALLYSAIPAYAAFARRQILQDVIGHPVAALPEWTSRWARNGDLTVRDVNGDGVIQPDDLHIADEVIVLATPEMAGLPHTIAALVAVGGLAAALSTADGLLLVIASAVAHDLYFRTLSPRAGPQKRLLLGRVMVLLAALAAAFTATRQLRIIVQLVAWAFSLAAATIFPALVLGIFWKRANGKGVVAGMLCGLVVTLSYMLTVFIDPERAVLGIGDGAAGIFGMPVCVIVTWLVSSLTAAPSAQVRQLVDLVRSPEAPEE
jgi:cation/acetate symporter